MWEGMMLLSLTACSSSAFRSPQETGLSLDEEPDTDEMWADPGEGTHDVPDHASSRAP